jgi:amino acid adenylation domain-containing protein
MTGNERMTFCNTGSEAVMAALRVSRTVTGRNSVVVFEGSYHGQFDEVLVKSARRSPQALPVAAGIPPESVANMTVLEYGSDASLAWIREHADELAAVVVEPVQSRHPTLVPAEFLRELRAITAASGTALVFDEVVTGFRVHPGGMQAVLGIRADLATYGKVVGGGLPIGVLAGTGRFMDALDGGMWQFGDDSYPAVAPTFFAGTFVRHPLAMAAVLAVLHHLRDRGPALQREVTELTAGLVGRLNTALATRGVTTRIEQYASVFYANFAREERLSGLLYYHLRNRGIYLQEGFPCFLTTAHTQADVDAIVAAFESSLSALQSVGIFGVARVGAVSIGEPAAAVPAVALEFALTESQTEIWLAAQVSDDASCAFNESVTLVLNGAVDREAFDRAWRHTVARHESLRAAFSPTGERMRIAASRDVPLAELDFGAGPDREGRFARFVDEEARKPFDLVDGPLVRGTLVRFGPDGDRFVLTAHHIVCDGWSINTLLEELAEQYRAEVTGVRCDLPVPLGFSAYALHERARDAGARAGVERYWLEQFATPVQPLDLPADRPRPATRTYRGATRSTHFERSLYLGIKEAGARQGCTLFVTLLAAYHALLGRLSDRHDVVVGVPTAGQAAHEDAPLVGHCVNFLPIRARWVADTPFTELLKGIKRTMLDAYEHQEYTLGTLVRTLAPARESNRVPLAEVQFNLERLAEKLDFGALSASVEPNGKAFVNFDLFLNIVESSDGLRLDVDYSTELFDAATINRFLEAYRTLLKSVIDDANALVTRIALVPEAERELLVRTFNATARPYNDRSLHELIDERASEWGEKIAVRCADRSMTYSELRSRSNQLAHELHARGVKPGALVAVCVERTLDTIVSLLAVMKAGCAYVPLDPAHPEERLRTIAADAGVAVILVDDGTRASLVAPGTLVIDLQRDDLQIARRPKTAPVVTTNADDLAYVISTSGSTGKPKGVEITHRSVVNFLSSMREKPGFSSDGVLLAVTTIAFDIAGLELFLPLICAGTVIIASVADTTDGFALLRLSADATVMQATPAMWRLLLEAGFTGSPALRMFCGGEALPRELADRLLMGGGELWNMYGPTETTIWSACVQVKEGSHAISVGRPIANTQCYVLDSHDELLPLGAVGQLHIGGEGVARGYRDRTELTAERFVPNPFGPGLVYRTGDLARILPSGEIVLLGRRDHQVKLRGFRIELGEIEATLEKTGRLSAAAVALREDVPGEPRLVAYYVVRPGVPQTASSLRDAVAQALPTYMIPTHWVELSSMPLGPSGKLDRAALPAPQLVPGTTVPAVELPTAEAEHSAAMSETEAVLAAICRDVLRVERVAADANILALGADSLQLFAITARANARGLRLRAKDLFAHPTIGSLARRLEETAAEESIGVAV